jgi:hypothetical protein
VLPPTDTNAPASRLLFVIHQIVCNYCAGLVSKLAWDGIAYKNIGGHHKVGAIQLHALAVGVDSAP